MNVHAIQAVFDQAPAPDGSRSGARRFWTGREELILRTYYPSEGLEGCLTRLAGRSVSSIYQRAGLLKLVSPQAAKMAVPRQRWFPSPAIDAVIQSAYPRATSKGDVRKLAQTVGRPSWWVSRRANFLGLVAPRFREPPWTAAEEDLAHEHAHLCLDAIRRHLARKGFKRSETAIKVKLRRLGADRTDPDHFTAHALAEAMGIDAKTVTRWIINGLLVAKRRGTERVDAQGGDQWWIHRRNVRQFIIDNAALIDIRKVEKTWFIDLLAHGHQS